MSIMAQPPLFKVTKGKKVLLRLLGRGAGSSYIAELYRGRRKADDPAVQGPW